MQEDVVIGGLRFSGLRIFIFTTWLAVLAALLVVLFCVRDYTVIDPEVCTTGAASPFVKAEERTGLSRAHYRACDAHRIQSWLAAFNCLRSIFTAARCGRPATGRAARARRQSRRRCRASQLGKGGGVG